MCRLRHINDSVLSSLKMEGIRLLFLQTHNLQHFALLLQWRRIQHIILYLQHNTRTRHNKIIHFADQKRRLRGGCNLLRRCQETEETWKQAVTTRTPVLTLTQHRKQYSNGVISGFHIRGYEDNGPTGRGRINVTKTFRLVDIKHKITHFPSWSRSTTNSEFNPYSANVENMVSS
jgi:hypothetical protein